MLTPQEVSNHAFAKAVMGGYNMAMVDEFLDELTDDYTSLYKENAALKAKMKVLVDKVEEYRSTEDAMRAALLTAQKMADSMVAEAEEKKKSLLENAESEANRKIGALRDEVAQEERRLTAAKAETADFLGGVSRAMTTFCMGLLVFYGANELFYRVANVLFNSRTNLNDMTIAASINAAPRLTALIIVFLAPFVEEVLFRGLVFGCLKEKSRVAAYVISCVLFAFMHVWTFALSSWDWSYLILMLQYLVPGLVFAWAFDHSGTLWTSILLHATVNALALWAIVG